MRSLTWLLFLLVATIAALIFTGQWDLTSRHALDQLQELAEKHISAPPPLRGSTDRPGAALTAEGILRETNKHRAAAGLPALAGNVTLAAAAQAKVDDMFTQQYFEHESPTGEGPANVVETAGYDYLRVGENLALGNYASDADLVQAWMDSPGHRENILNAGFTELGIAATPGQFEGSRTWLAVQEFGLPATACPAPDPALRAAFEGNTSQASEAERAELASRTAEIEGLYDKAAVLAEQGNQKIKQGNEEIERGNEIYRETQDEEQARPHWDKGEQLQNEGHALHEQAQQQQATADQQRDELRQAQAAFNQQVDDRNTELKRLADTLNQQIDAYNQCLEEYND
jgi:uncharacterized protein YkwD